LKSDLLGLFFLKLNFKQLIEAVQKQDVALVLQLLSHSKPEDVNACISPSDKRTSLHVAASIPNTVITQLLIWVSSSYSKKKILKLKKIKIIIQIISLNSMVLMWTVLIARVKTRCHMPRIRIHPNALSFCSSMGLKTWIKIQQIQINSSQHLAEDPNRR
jgi:hypothetical protein